MPLYSSLVRHQTGGGGGMSVPGNMCKVPGKFLRDFCREMEDAAFCLTERK